MKMGNVLRILGWIVLVGGSCSSIGVFWIDPMNGTLSALMVIGIAASVVGGLVLRWLGKRVDRARLASGG
jgi:hypothetical protein